VSWPYAPYFHLQIFPFPFPTDILDLFISILISLPGYEKNIFCLLDDSHPIGSDYEPASMPVQVQIPVSPHVSFFSMTILMHFCLFVSHDALSLCTL